MLERHFDHPYYEVRWVEPVGSPIHTGGKTHREPHPEGVLCSTPMESEISGRLLWKKLLDLNLPSLLFTHVSSHEDLLQSIGPLLVETHPRTDLGVRVWIDGDMLYGANREEADRWSRDTEKEVLQKAREAFPQWDWRIPESKDVWWLEAICGQRTMVLENIWQNHIGYRWYVSLGRKGGREVKFQLRHTFNWSLAHLKEVLEMLSFWMGEEDGHAQ